MEDKREVLDLILKSYLHSITVSKGIFWKRKERKFIIEWYNKELETL